MKHTILGMILALCIFALAACANQPAAPDASTAPEPEHSHTPTMANNMIPHEEGGYCGNTTTSVKAADWEQSFWGSDSVELTDLLLYLDYSEDICECLPEVTVTTEFSDEPYGVNLSDCYARHGDKQVTLTEEQVETIRAILDRAKAGTNA